MKKNYNTFINHTSKQYKSTICQHQQRKHKPQISIRGLFLYNQKDLTYGKNKMNFTEIKTNVDKVKEGDIWMFERWYLTSTLNSEDIKGLFSVKKETTKDEIVDILGNETNIANLKQAIDSVIDDDNITSINNIIKEDGINKEDFKDLLILHMALADLLTPEDISDVNFDYDAKANEYFTQLKTAKDDVINNQDDIELSITKTATEILNQTRTKESAEEFINNWNEAEFNKIVDGFDTLTNKNQTKLEEMLSAYTSTTIIFSSLSVPADTLDYPTNTKIIATWSHLITFWNSAKEYQRRIDGIAELTKEDINNNMDYLLKKGLDYKSNKSYYTTLTDKIISLSSASDYSLITKYVNICKNNKKYLWTNTSWTTIINNLFQFIDDNEIEDKNLLADLTKLKANLNNWWEALSIKNLWWFVRWQIMRMVDMLWLDEFMDQMWRWESMMNALYSKFDLTTQQNTALENVMWTYKPTEQKDEIGDATYNRIDLEATRKAQFLNNRNLLDPNLVNMIAKENLELEEDNKWKIELDNDQKNKVLENIMNNGNFIKDIESWIEDIATEFDNAKIAGFITAAIMNYKAGGKYLSKVYERNTNLWWSAILEIIEEDEDIKQTDAETTLKEISEVILDENNIEEQFNKIFLWEEDSDQEEAYELMCENIDDHKTMIAGNLISYLTKLSEDDKLNYNQTKITEDLEKVKELDTNKDGIIDDESKITINGGVLKIDNTKINFNKYEEQYSKNLEKIQNVMKTAKETYTESDDNGGLPTYKNTIKTEYDKIFSEDNYKFITENIDDYKNFFTSTTDWDNYIKTYLNDFANICLSGL